MYAFLVVLLRYVSPRFFTTSGDLRTIAPFWRFFRIDNFLADPLGRPPFPDGLFGERTGLLKVGAAFLGGCFRLKTHKPYQHITKLL